MNIENFERFSTLNKHVNSHAYQIAKGITPFTLKSFAIHLGKSAQNTNQTLRNFTELGLVVKVGYGKYSLGAVGLVVEKFPIYIKCGMNTMRMKVLTL